MKRYCKQMVLVMTLLPLLFIFTSCNTSNTGVDSESIKMYPTGFANGTCDGVGDIVWGMSYDEILEIENAKENGSNQIVFEKIEFAECEGELICKFEDTHLNSFVYSFEGENPYENYGKIVEELTTVYGEPLSMASLSEAMEQNTMRTMDMWKENVYTSSGDRVVILAEMKPPKGWIVVNLMIQP